MISVIIPTHSRSELLVRAIESVQKQTYKDLEIIVVSDGSTDSTKKVVQNLAGTDMRISFIEYFPSKGGNFARNTGIKVAKGEYIAFLDDDDEWLPEKLEKQIKIMNLNEKIGLVYTGVKIIYVNEGVSYNSKARIEGDMRKDILFENYIGTTSTVLLKKTIIDEVGGFDEKLPALQDYDLWIRVCQKCDVGVVPEELIKYYNYTEKKQISALTQKYIDAFLYINQKYKNLFCSLSKEQIKIKKMNEYYLLINKAFRNNEGKIARYYINQALKNGSKKAVIFYFLSFFNYRTILKIRSKI